MEGKKSISINLSVLILIILIVIALIVVCSVSINKLKSQKGIENPESNMQNTEETLEENTVYNNSSISNNTNLVNNSTSDNNTSNIIGTTDVNYEFSIRDEIFVTITATKNGKTISKEFEMSAMIDKTGTTNIQSIGKVALVSDSGGEYCGVHIYQLVNDDIVLLGDIDCGADMIKDATYTSSIKNEGITVINATRNGDTFTNEFEMSAAIANISTMDLFTYGKVVLVAETGGEYYGIQVYRLSEDYITGETLGIKNVGFINCSL